MAKIEGSLWEMEGDFAWAGLRLPNGYYLEARYTDGFSYRISSGKKSEPGWVASVEGRNVSGKVHPMPDGAMDEAVAAWQAANNGQTLKQTPGR